MSGLDEKPGTDATTSPADQRNSRNSEYGDTKLPSMTKEPEVRQLDDDSSSRSETPQSHGEPRVEEAAVPGPPFQKEAAENYKPRTAKFWSVILSTFVATFIVALDRTILSTAIPQITNDFESLGDIGWYGSAYMLATAAFQLLFGRIYRFYDLRLVFLQCIVVFEVGSVICGSAPNSIVFIVGRSIAGMASAGIMTGSMLVIIPMVPLHKRPMFQCKPSPLESDTLFHPVSNGRSPALFGLIFGLSSAIGPLIGGAFTEKATWRWCFYMNLPIGGAAFACLFFFLTSPKKPKQQLPLKDHIMRLDPLGTFFFIPCMVCLVLALQWGGSTYEWDNWRLIVLWVIFGVTAACFGVVQVKMPKSASLPVRVITQRTMLVGAWYMILLSGAMFLCIYYLPLWCELLPSLLKRNGHWLICLHFSSNYPWCQPC